MPESAHFFPTTYFAIVHTRMSLVVELDVCSSNGSLNLLFILSQAKKWGTMALRPPTARVLHSIDHKHVSFTYVATCKNFHVLPVQTPQSSKEHDTEQ